MSEFAELKNDRFLKALLREEVDQTPVWMMRQAGRYLPEYRKTRQQAGDFMSLCQSPELACEVTMQPLRRYPFDAAILFSDILTIPDAMGQGLFFAEGEGPKFRKTIRSAADVDQLPDVNIASELSYVTDAVSVIRKELNGSVPLIGFSGSPWTLATYMIEGGGSKDFRIAKQFMYDNPEAMHLLLEKLASAVIDYLNAQIKAGAQAVQIFDTWGGILTPAAYREFSLNYMNKIVDGLIKENDGRQVPAILFTKNGGQWLEDIADSGCQAIGLDWTTDIGQARARIGDRVALQGNMDPTMLYASPQAIRKEVGSILQSFGQGAGHVFNLGHGITPEVNPDNVAVFVESVHELSAQYHA
ncbi:MAG: uroporphyrinogen decarboxylase [Gammaproteobacteria bacterium]|nr:uroporphyrinogen decarboxylase [Gammaproteobacteria bacterium]MBT3858284.1 uroporphyrinogen decarboxylase [Gammaproteobacteria bacterium]MBT3988593.1 uroporphyrinogen decarboxylase [Gammaproteobacteria bacterium]MBT4580469.1 uroporphyrinogen decarboxylase [Gammaproteobacteria bacterium]MBT4657797.1 uroporphyrinogen decarboxylase [Gammaproteobacteria bacterium]